MLLNYYYTSILLIKLYYENINKEEDFLQNLLKTHLTTSIQTISTTTADNPRLIFVIVFAKWIFI